MPVTMNGELIVVLDVDTLEEARRIVSLCKGCDWFKVGAQLFTRCGPEAVREVMADGKRVFLDLKYHDIPNTVRSAAAAAAELGASLFTVHASGGARMIEAARGAVNGTDTRILAVTVLTSLDDTMLSHELGIGSSVVKTVPRWAKMAVEAGAHGIVCSPHEVRIVREAVGPEPIIVTPGIRPHWAAQNDQVRITTPREAVESGANMIVVGRPILNHDNPAEAVALIKEELSL